MTSRHDDKTLAEAENFAMKYGGYLSPAGWVFCNSSIADMLDAARSEGYAAGRHDERQSELLAGAA